MSKQKWKVIALSLTTLLMIVLSLIGTTPLLGKELSQRTSIQRCGLSSTDWISQAVESLDMRYGVDVCRQGKFQVSETETRADMASWLATVMDSVNEKYLEPAVKDLPRKSELDSLNQLLDQITAQVEAFERR